MINHLLIICSKMVKYEEIVSKHWGKMAKKQNTHENWTDSELVRRYINKCQTGNEELGWLEYFCQKYLLNKGHGVKRGVSIGCGSGALERECRIKNICETIDAFDISSGSINEAKKIASNEGITGINYQVQNLENYVLPTNQYDVVFASSSVHHIKNLEDFFENIRNCLKQNGLVVMAEFVGPSQFQFPKKQVELINEVLEELSSQYKIKTNSFDMKDSFEVPSLDYMNIHDPSESIRSEEIVPLLRSYFDILEKNDYGGTLLHMVLKDIVINFVGDNYKDTTVLSLLILLEKILLREKIIQSDFSYIIAKKK